MLGSLRLLQAIRSSCYSRGWSDDHFLDLHGDALDFLQTISQPELSYFTVIERIEIRYGDIQLQVCQAS